MDLKNENKSIAGVPALDSEQTEPDTTVEIASLTAVSSSFEDAFDNGALIQTLEAAGFRFSSKFEHQEIDHSFYYNEANDSAIIFTDSLSLPGQTSSQGASAIVPHENRLIPALLIPAPSAQTFTQTILSEFSEEERARAVEYYMKYCSAEGQIEVYLHESIHLDQITEQTPWGLAVASHMTHQMLESYRSQGLEPTVSLALMKALERGNPSVDEMIAAQLVQEIKAHAVNIDTDPVRAEAALQVIVMLDQHITEPVAVEESLPEVKRVLEAWGAFISQYANYPEPTDAAIDIGARWIMEARTI